MPNVLSVFAHLTGTIARDATEAFEDVGHSDEARALLKDMLVGDFEPTDVSSISVHPLYSFPTPFFLSLGAQDEALLHLLLPQQRGKRRCSAGLQVRRNSYPCLRAI